MNILENLNKEQEKYLIDSFNKYCMLMYGKKHKITVHNLKIYFLDLINTCIEQEVTELYIAFDASTNKFWYNCLYKNMFCTDIIIDKDGMRVSIIKYIKDFNKLL